MTTVDTSQATVFSRRIGELSLTTRQSLVGPYPVITLVLGPGIELPAVFHGDGLPGLIFLPYRAEGLRGRIDEILDASGVEVRRIPIREDEYRRVMDAIGAHDTVVIDTLVLACCREDDGVDNYAD